MPITVKTDIAGSEHDCKRAPCIMLFLPTDIKIRRRLETTLSSKFGLRWARADLLKNTACIVVNEAPILEQKIFEIVDVVLNDLYCTSERTEKRLSGLGKPNTGD